MWIARDKDGALCLYSTKPFKSIVMWKSFNSAIKIPTEMFPEVKWENEEPVEVVIKRKEE